MSAFEITDSLPLPLPGNTKYPFYNMKVGQSFFVSGTSHTTRTAAASWGRRRGVKFACRVVTEDGIRGFRVWRTK